MYKCTVKYIAKRKRLPMFKMHRKTIPGNDSRHIYYIVFVTSHICCDSIKYEFMLSIEPAQCLHYFWSHTSFSQGLLNEKTSLEQSLAHIQYIVEGGLKQSIWQFDTFGDIFQRSRLMGVHVLANESESVYYKSRLLHYVSPRRPDV